MKIFFYSSKNDKWVSLFFKNKHKIFHNKYWEPKTCMNSDYPVFMQSIPEDLLWKINKNHAKVNHD